MKYGFLSDIANVNFSLPSPPGFIKHINTKNPNPELKFLIGSSTWSDKDFKGNF